MPSKPVNRDPPWPLLQFLQAAFFISTPFDPLSSALTLRLRMSPLDAFPEDNKTLNLVFNPVCHVGD